MKAWEGLQQPADDATSQVDKTTDKKNNPHKTF